MILLIPFSMNNAFNSSTVASFSIAMISVRGTMQSRTLMLEKSRAFWNIFTSVLISASLSEAWILLCMKWSKSTLVKALSLASLLILVPW